MRPNNWQDNGQERCRSPSYGRPSAAQVQRLTVARKTGSYSGRFKPARKRCLSRLAGDVHVHRQRLARAEDLVLVDAVPANQVRDGDAEAVGDQVEGIPASYLVMQFAGGAVGRRG